LGPHQKSDFDVQMSMRVSPQHHANTNHKSLISVK